MRQKRQHHYATLTSHNEFEITKLTMHVNLKFFTSFFIEKLKKKKKKIILLICFCKQKPAKTRGPFISQTLSTKLIQRPGLVFHSLPSFSIILLRLSCQNVSTGVLPILLLSDLLLFSRNFISNLPQQWFCLSPLSSTPEATCLPISVYQHHPIYLCPCLKSISSRIISA